LNFNGHSGASSRKDLVSNGKIRQVDPEDHAVFDYFFKYFPEKFRIL